MSVSIIPSHSPSVQELHDTITAAFTCLLGQDHEQFDEENSQSLDEWFDTNALLTMLDTGVLLEARDDKGALVGVSFIAKQHPISWPDGKKAELFVLAVVPQVRGQGIGKQLLAASEEAARGMGASMIIINTNVLMRVTAEFYKHAGYKELGVLHGYYGNGDAVFLAKTL